MSGSRITRCSFCRLLVKYAHTRQFHGIANNRKLQHMSTVSAVRSLSTTKVCYGETKDGDSKPESSDSDSSSDSSSSDSESDTEKPAETQKLTGNSLLSKLQSRELGTSVSDQLKLDLEKPETHSLEKKLKVPSEKSKKTSLWEKLDSDESQTPSLEKKLEVGSDKSEIPSLLEQLKFGSKQSAKASSSEQQKQGSEQSATTPDKERQTSPTRLDSSLVLAAKSVAEVLPGNKVETEAALLGQLLSQQTTTKKQKAGESPQDKSTKPESLSEIMEGLKIFKSEEEKEGQTKPGSGRRSDMEEMESRRPDSVYRRPGTGLFNGKPLGIFSMEDMDKSKTDEKKSLFDIVAEEQKQKLLTYPARNAFEEQIQWTRDGKLWTFPIDNEAGWEEEKNVGFHEHVFLEHKLADFPKRGPIRHFMELVTVALSKNPYVTVQQKHEHIDWYKKYFKEKQEMLEERLGKDGIIGGSEQASSENKNS